MKRFLLLATLTILICGSLEAKRIDRGLGNPYSVYIPQGTFSLGAAVGYNQYNAAGATSSAGATLLNVVTDVDGGVRVWNASANAYLFVADNMAVGLRLGYTNTQVDVNNANLMDALKLSNKHVVNSMFSGALAFRAYMPLFNSKIFALFAEARLTGGFGYGKDYAQTERGKEGTYSDLFQLSLGLYPGVSVFLADFVSLEVSLPLLEGGHEWNLQVKGQAHDSSLTHGFFNYKPNLLGLNLGVIFHF